MFIFGFFKWILIGIIAFIIILVSTVTTSDWNFPKDEIINAYNVFLQNFCVVELSKDKDIEGQRVFGADKYVGTYKAEYDNVTSEETIFGGTALYSLYRENGDHVKLKIKIENTKSHYPMISDFDKLPDPVKKMLTETPQGLRNQTIMFLVPFFRNTLGLNIQTIKQIMVVWGEHCTPKMTQEAVETDVDRIYKKGFKGGFGKYTVELRKAYGYLEFNKYTRNNKIIIPNAIFNDFDVISDGAIRIYLSMKLAKSLDDLKELTKEDIQKYADISERTVERNMKDLVSMGYVCKRKENRRLGEKYIYYINPYFSTIEGYTMIENSLVKLMLQELTDGESKLYIYLCKMIGSSKNECWSSQKYIAKNIGKTQQGISLITDKLSEKRYIKKTTLITDDNIKVCTYNLNY